jgi:hypothetical protein
MLSAWAAEKVWANQPQYKNRRSLHKRKSQRSKLSLRHLQPVMLLQQRPSALDLAACSVA